MNDEDLNALNEEIAGMARAGLPLDQGLAALAADMGWGQLRGVTSAIAEDLRLGRTLPEAIQRQGRRIPPYYAGLVSAGIRTGRIAEVLTTLTVYSRSIASLRAVIVEALFYPAVVLAFATVLAGASCVYILPQFDQIFHDFNMRLPALTELAIQFGRKPLQYLIVPIAVLLVGLILISQILGFTAQGRRFRARMIYALPVLGTLVRSARLAAFTELMGILVDHETPLPEAFRLAGESSSDPLMAGAAQQIHRDLDDGVPLGEALRGRGLVPAWVSWMVGLGERRGNLGQTLHQIADMYRRQVTVRAALLRSILPPFLVLCTAGLFVTFFIAVMILPMVRLIEGLSK